MRTAHTVAPNLAYPPQWRPPTTDIWPLARSKCRRRRRGAPACRRHARGGGRFPVLLPLRARNRLWFGPTKHFHVGRYMANRRSINSETVPQWVYLGTLGKGAGSPINPSLTPLPQTRLLQPGSPRRSPESRMAVPLMLGALRRRAKQAAMRFAGPPRVDATQYVRVLAPTSDDKRLQWRSRDDRGESFL